MTEKSDRRDHGERTRAAGQEEKQDGPKGEMAEQVGLNALVRVDAVQVEDLPVYRSVSRSTYILSGMVGFLALSVFLILFFKPKNKQV